MFWSGNRSIKNIDSLVVLVITWIFLILFGLANSFAGGMFIAFGSLYVAFEVAYKYEKKMKRKKKKR